MVSTDPEECLIQPLVSSNAAHKTDHCAADQADAAYRKISQRILPVMFMVTLVCYLDRTNISLAAVSMSKDIDISKTEYGIAASLFFVSYAIFQIPSNAVLKRVGAPLWMGIILIGWGMTASLTAFVHNTDELYFMRLLLGAFEAGTFPGVNYYLSLFYPHKRFSFALGIAVAGLLMGLCISAPLAGGLLSMHGILGFSGWQWLLFIEGLPSVALGVFMMFYLPKLPTSCKFLSDNEKKALEEDGCTTSKEAVSTVHLVKKIVLNGQLWLNLIASNLQGIARYAAQFWTPLWIDAIVSGEGLDLKTGVNKGHGDNDNGVMAAFLTAIPYCCAAIVSVLIGCTSTKFNDRKFHVVFFTALGGVVFCLLPQVNGWGLVPGVIALTLINSAVGGVNGAIVALAALRMTNESKVFGFAWFNAIGSLCGLVGPLAVGLVVDWTGSYVASLYFAGTVLFLSAVLFLLVDDSDC